MQESCSKKKELLKLLLLASNTPTSEWLVYKCLRGDRRSDSPISYI